jgi:hypothetical protein
MAPMPPRFDVDTIVGVICGLIAENLVLNLCIPMWIWIHNPTSRFFSFFLTMAPMAGVHGT